VSWKQAAAYCRWAGGRLPTEEEWERTARGPKSTKYPWGNEDINPLRANYEESSIGHPTPVGLYPSGITPEGALDLLGNVFEWTSSKYSERTKTYVWKGGSFNYSGALARSSVRTFGEPETQARFLGFRMATSIT